MAIKETPKLQDCECIHRKLNQLIIKCLSGSHPSGLDKQIEKINSLFENLYRQSLSENYFWQYCPSKVFELYFEKEYQKFLKEKIDETPTACHLRIINNLFKNTNRADRPIEVYIQSDFMYRLRLMNQISDTDNERYNYQPFTPNQRPKETIYINYLYGENLERIKDSQKHKIEFVLQKIKEVTNPPIEKKVEQVKEVYLDFSDNSIIEKIGFLHELGIIEFLLKKQPFNTSTNKLAEVISAFTGISQTTAQSYLNPIISGVKEAKNNPLTQKHIDTVSQKLIKMGYSK